MKRGPVPSVRIGRAVLADDRRHPEIDVHETDEVREPLGLVGRFDEAERVGGELRGKSGQERDADAFHLEARVPVDADVVHAPLQIGAIDDRAVEVRVVSPEHDGVQVRAVP
jgi:hypothetical protein